MSSTFYLPAPKGLENYYGGKGASGAYQTIINEIPPHEVLSIPFLGAGNVVRRIKEAEISILSDIDPKIVDQWDGNHPDGWIINNEDWILNINKARHQFSKGKKVVVYADPPYPILWRKTPLPKYAYEMDEEEHFYFIEYIKSLPFPVLVSSNVNPIYEEELKDWRQITFTVKYRRGVGTEVLYMNFDNPGGLLHDTTYLGKDFRKRQDIKRLKQRWKKRLFNLDPKTRYSILSELVEHFPDIAAANLPLLAMDNCSTGNTAD